MANINRTILKDQIESQIVNVKAFEDAATKIVTQEFNKSKASFFKSVENNVAVQEIRDGPLVQKSKFLTKGNLFAALGFEKDSDPVGALVEFLRANITKPKLLRKTKNRITYQATAPSLKDIRQFTLLEWIGRSWIDCIEKGVPFLKFFKFSPEGKFNPEVSRSTSGVQDVKHPPRLKTTQKRKGGFFTVAYRRFINRLRKGKDDTSV